jgi:glutamyl-tRNA reductase
MELVVIGLSHHTAPVTLRERIAFPPQEAEEILRAGDSAERIPERLLLSTCNRTELYALAETSEAGRELFLDLVRRHRRLELNGHAECLYLHRGREMVDHLFRVASSIDSMIVGEVQILGQVHEAFEIARRAGSTGPLMHRLFEAAFRVGKRVRTETEIAIGAVSVSYAAVTLASRIFSDLDKRAALLVGSGETGALAARHLLEVGIGQITVTNRTFDRAVALAAELGAVAVPFESLETAMSTASIVVTATASPEPIIRADLVKRVLAGRRNRPLLILDIAVPRDVEPVVRSINNVFLYDIDAIEGLVKENLERRRREIPRVETIIQQETELFFGWYAGLEATPVIRELREHYERVRHRELEKVLHRFCDKDREQVEAVTRGLVNKLLHEPTLAIRRLPCSGTGSLARMELVRRLFGLIDAGKEDGDGDA